ncbi:MAG: pantothenate synthetase [Dehalococcoidia bacterium]|nr:MAG: pantothenate synthetase [Dehalococcoidia bacterium]
MIVARSRAELNTALDGAPRPIGVVPTMGALHEGHLALIRRARAENATALVTIFVNPTQFLPHEDFSRYPRPIERDLALCEQSAVDIVFTPPVEEMYPPGFATTVVVQGPSRRWEGEHRPGHFNGVATVVARLLNLTRADRAYFGEKDYQQLQVVRRLVADLALPVDIVSCETVRDPDGLALSSRNVYLSEEQREQALALSRALRTAAGLAEAGERDIPTLEAAMREVVERAGLEIDYLVVVDPETLEPLQRLEGAARALGAVRLGTVRLIDNLPIPPPRPTVPSPTLESPTRVSS